MSPMNLLALIMATALVAGCAETTGPSEPSERPTFTVACATNHNSGECRERLIQAGVATGTMFNICKTGFSWACAAAAGLAGAAWLHYDNGVDAFGHRHEEDCGFCTDPETEDHDLWTSVGRVTP
jgi:hypothetical protein